ncbi:MAG: hypothetical protein KKA32_00860 [Actinobacteria bacterium]|nr:hypothetical protein [Actinomycetota bacterium]
MPVLLFTLRFTVEARVDPVNSSIVQVDVEPVSKPTDVLRRVRDTQLANVCRNRLVKFVEQAANTSRLVARDGPVGQTGVRIAEMAQRDWQCLTGRWLVIIHVSGTHTLPQVLDGLQRINDAQPAHEVRWYGLIVSPQQGADCTGLTTGELKFPAIIPHVSAILAAIEQVIIIDG